MTDDDPKPKEGSQPQDEPPPKDPFDQRIEELEKMADAMKGPAAKEPEDEFAERLAGFEKRVAEVKKGRLAKERELKRQADNDRDSSRGLGIGMTIAYTIIGLPLLGYGVGWVVDRQTGGVLWSGLGMLAGAVAGIAMAFVMIQHTSNRS